MTEQITPPRASLLTIFLTMLKIGAFTFGGGYAMIAVLEAEFVEQKKWLHREEFLNMVSIAESTPGPIAINSSTYIGYRLRGFVGALVGTLGMVLPSLCIIFSISLFFDAFLSLTFVAYAFEGIRVAVVYLILSAGIKMARGIDKTPLSYAIFGAVGLSMLLTSLFAVRFFTIGAILASGLLGVAVWAIARLRRGKTEKGGDSE